MSESDKVIKWYWSFCRSIKNFKYEQDHLHPFDRLDGSKQVYVSMEDWRSNRNRLSNLQLIEGRSNGSKNNMRSVDYYNDRNDDEKTEFCKHAIIPDGVSLELEYFGVHN